MKTVRAGRERLAVGAALPRPSRATRPTDEARRARTGSPGEGLFDQDLE